MPNDKPMLGGRELSEFELAKIRMQIESMQSIDIVSDEIRALIAARWLHLLAKIGSPGPTTRGH